MLRIGLPSVMVAISASINGLSAVISATPSAKAAPQTIVSKTASARMRARVGLTMK
jgi:hypothetical protein